MPPRTLSPRAPRPPARELGLGVGLRHEHYRHVLAELSAGRPLGVDFFEVISENLMGEHGLGRHVVERVRAELPLVLHGVSLGIGSSDPLDTRYLDALRALCDEFEPALVSDHLCWTGIHGYNSHDLLPLPLTEEALGHVADRVQAVQERLGRQLLLENPSSYLEFESSTMRESAFLAALVARTGCGLLLDVNNVFVSSYNHGWDPEAYLRELPPAAIEQIHLAGPTDTGALLIDTHDHPVPTRVWELYRLAIEHAGRAVPTLLEWDASIPPFPELVAHARLASRVLAGDIPAVEVSGPVGDSVSNPLPSAPGVLFGSP